MITAIATFTTSTLAVGSHTITADYINADGNFIASSGTVAAGQVVNTADTTAVVGTTAPTTVYGQSVTFSATVSAITAGLPIPTGIGRVLRWGDRAGHGDSG